MDPIVINSTDLWLFLIGGAGGIVTLSAAGTAIANLINKAKSPNKKQNERLDALEDEVKKIHARLELGNKRFQSDAEKTCALEDSMKKSNRVIVESLQALTAHAIDGNNIDKLKASEEALNEYLRSKI